MRDTSRHDGLVIARGIKHWSLLQVTKSPEPIVGCGSSDKSTDSLAYDLLLGNACILNGLVRTLEQESLLGI